VGEGPGHIFIVKKVVIYTSRPSWYRKLFKKSGSKAGVWFNEGVLDIKYMSRKKQEKIEKNAPSVKAEIGKSIRHGKIYDYKEVNNEQ